MRRALILALLPLLLVGPSLLPGRAFLPQHPAALVPLAAERPEDAERVRAGQSYLTADRLFPVLTDELEIGRRLRAGRLPTWEPRLGLGMPLFGGTIVGPLYPPNLLRFVLAPELAGALLALVALFLAGMGAWLLFERLGLGPGACAIGALAYQGLGFGAPNLHYAMKVDAALWLPWSLWAVEGVLAARPRAGLALFASIALSFLAGFPGVASFALAVVLVRIPARALALGAPVRRPARALVLALLGVLGAAAQLGPTAEASLASMRVPQTAAALEPQSASVASLATLVVPDAFGTPQSAVFASRDPVTWWLAREPEAERVLGANLLEWNLFGGVLVLALALAGAAAGGRRAAFPAALAVLAVGFAQGWPGVALLHRVPGLDLGAPTRSASVLWLALPWLAAVGAERWLAGSRAARGSALGVLAALTAGALLLRATWDPAAWAAGLPELLGARFGADADTLAATVDLAHAPEAGARLARALGALAAWSVAGAVALLVAKRTTMPAWIPPATVVALEALAFAGPHLAPRHVGDLALFPESPAMERIAAAAGDGRVVRLDRSESGVADVLELARPNLPHAYGIADLTAYVVFTPRTTVELLRAVDPRSPFRSGVSRISDPALLGHPVLDMARVTCVLSRAPVDHPRLEPVLEHDGFHVYRRHVPVPPARVVPVGIVAATDAIALELLAQGSIDPLRATVLAPGVEPGEPPGQPFEAGSVAVERSGPNRLDATVRGSSGGWLVFAEGWLPGWKATVNGEDAEVVRVDHAFRAVRVPAGDSVVRTKYEPWSLRIGFALSVAALLLALGLGRLGGSARSP